MDGLIALAALAATFLIGIPAIRFAARQTHVSEQGLTMQVTTAHEAERQALKELAQNTLAALLDLRDDMDSLDKRMQVTVEALRDDQRSWVHESLNMHAENRNGLIRIEGALRDLERRL